MNSTKVGLLLSSLRRSHALPSVRHLSVTPVCNEEHRFVFILKICD